VPSFTISSPPDTDNDIDFDIEANNNANEEKDSRLHSDVSDEDVLATKVNRTPIEGQLLETLISLCDDLAWGRPAKEEDLYRLTSSSVAPPDLARLAEAFGLMLVKLEARTLELDSLVACLRNQNLELEEARNQLSKRNELLQETLAGSWQQSPFLGQCEAVVEVVKKARAAARYPINTLILGPTGTGKEVLAKFIFFCSPRSEKNFVAVNCSAIPESLFECEMFGREKGVAPGGDRRAGLLESADGGTLFLDEVGELSLACQAKLLRVLEERRVRRVGSRQDQEVDLHVISATNADLTQAVKAKRFREDLLWRLNVVELRIPPLSERGRDVYILAKHFLRLHATRLGRPELTIGEQAEAALMAYSWPGNVRELNNEMERAAALAKGPVLELCDLSERLLAPKSTESQSFAEALSKAKALSQTPALGRLKDISEAAIQEALRRHGGNKTRAARDLGLSREGLRKMLQRLGSLT
jgi:DNA-binding NtrC family response regulator